MRRRDDPSFPSHNTFSRFGIKSQLAAAVLARCQAIGEDHVAQICEPLAADVSEAPATEEPGSVLGYVYLIKSGKHYKIGRSVAVGRRERELAIQLPEPVKTVHTIKTDDPVGIEAYWHRRFEEKRGNGEWFRLTAEDVKVFRRRRFM